jgi:hypothetical protein
MTENDKNPGPKSDPFYSLPPTFRKKFNRLVLALQTHLEEGCCYIDAEDPQSVSAAEEPFSHVVQISADIHQLLSEQIRKEREEENKS